MDKQARDEFIDLFAEGFQGLVVPEIESLRKDMDRGFTEVNKRLRNIESRLDTAESRLESVGIRLDRVIANQLEDRSKTKNVDERVKKLEGRRALT